jgi:tetratricopeptide (TPR) repeat protein
LGLSELFERFFMKKIDGKNAHDWFELGAKERDPAKKVECFETVVKLKPGFVGAWNLLGTAHADCGEFKKALECYNQALSICPSYREARLNKKNLEKKLKDAVYENET